MAFYKAPERQEFNLNLVIMKIVSYCLFCFIGNTLPLM